MARSKFAKRQQVCEEYNEHHRDVLLTGGRHTFFAGETLGFPRQDDRPSSLDGWEALRGELLPAWIAERPGTRPWAWWLYDAPESTRRVLRGFDALADPEAPEWIRGRLSFGAARCFGRHAFKEGVVAESEAAFLDRHNLLGSEERKALGDDYEHEEILWRPIENDNDGSGSVLEPALA